MLVLKRLAQFKGLPSVERQWGCKKLMGATVAPGLEGMEEVVISGFKNWNAQGILKCRGQGPWGYPSH